MVEYAAVFPPYDDALITSLFDVVKQVFGGAKRNKLVWTLQSMPDVSVQVARKDEIIGFKIGYALTPLRYYSYLGGVDEEHRRQGIALRLMREQHQWAQSAGYTSIETGATNSNVAMLTLNLRVGFRVFGSYARTEVPRVMMIREF